MQLARLIQQFQLHLIWKCYHTIDTPTLTLIKISISKIFITLTAKCNLKYLRKSKYISNYHWFKYGGKTTFIKTVGVNIILSQTLNICLAKSANIPNLIVMSSIKREDNLEDSKSYFFVEIEGLTKIS